MFHNVPRFPFTDFHWENLWKEKEKHTRGDKELELKTERFWLTCLFDIFCSCHITVSSPKFSYVSVEYCSHLSLQNKREMIVKDYFAKKIRASMTARSCPKLRRRSYTGWWKFFSKASLKFMTGSGERACDHGMLFYLFVSYYSLHYVLDVSFYWEMTQEVIITTCLLWYSDLLINIISFLFHYL